jgi:hypothetical protein
MVRRPETAAVWCTAFLLIALPLAAENAAAGAVSVSAVSAVAAAPAVTSSARTAKPVRLETE